MIVNCPLCKCSKTSPLETIKGEDLNVLYARKLGIRDALKAKELQYRECSNCKLIFFWPMETGEEWLYEQLQAFDWYYMTSKEEYLLALQFVPKEGLVLEVGSGKAAFAHIVGPDRYTGLEFNDRAIEKARAIGITLIKEGVENHARRKAQQYDAVVSFQVLEHVSSPSEFIKGCLDCLKPGGTLILAVPSSDGFTGSAVNNFLNMPPHHVSIWSTQVMNKIAELYGLELVTVVHEPVAVYHHYWARKVMLESRLRKMFGIHYKLIDSRFVPRILSKMAATFSRLSHSSLIGMKGHTMVACYRKLTA